MSEHNREMDIITVHIFYPLLLDKLNTLAAEYSMSADLLINLAVKRLTDDIDFLRNLRAGKIELK